MNGDDSFTISMHSVWLGYHNAICGEVQTQDDSCMTATEEMASAQVIAVTVDCAQMTAHCCIDHFSHYL